MTIPRGEIFGIDAASYSIEARQRLAYLENRRSQPALLFLSTRRIQQHRYLSLTVTFGESAGVALFTLSIRTARNAGCFVIRP